MRIFVTGATGVIGKRVLPLLLARGHAVTALAHAPAALHQLQQAGAAAVTADLFDRSQLGRALVGHDAVINLATQMPATAWKMMMRSAWRLNDRIRSEGAANVAAAAHGCGAGLLIQESFALAYPDRGAQWIDETTPLEPAAYNRTVLDAEKSAAAFASAGGSGVVLRFAAFYGPDAMQVRSYIDILRKGWAALPGGRDRFMSSISHDDAAAAVVAALSAPTGAYTVVDDEPVRREVYFGAGRKPRARPAEISAGLDGSAVRLRRRSDGALAAPDEPHAEVCDELVAAISERPRRMAGDAGTNARGLNVAAPIHARLFALPGGRRRCGAQMSFPGSRKRDDPALQFLDQSALRGQHAFQRLRNREPLRPVDFGKLPLRSGARRPLDGERVAHDARRVEVGVDGPCVDELAAGLPHRRQLDKCAVDRESRFFAELAQRRVQRCLALLDFTLGDRPGAVVALRPERAAGMHEEDLEHARRQPVGKYARAYLAGHADARSIVAQRRQALTDEGCHAAPIAFIARM